MYTNIHISTHCSVSCSSVCMGLCYGMCSMMRARNCNQAPAALRWMVKDPSDCPRAPGNSRYEATHPDGTRTQTAEQEGGRPHTKPPWTRGQNPRNRRQ